MTHRTSADYYAGIPQYGQQQLVAQNDRLRDGINAALAIWETGMYGDPEVPFQMRDALRSALNVEGMNQ